MLKSNLLPGRIESFEPVEVSISQDCSPRPETIIIGLGNPILGDDGIGWRIVAEIRSRFAGTLEQLHNTPDFDFLSLGGLSLMERLVGYKRALLVDSIVSGSCSPGTTYFFHLEDLPPAPGHIASAHDTTLQDAINMGRSLGAILPEQIAILAVEILPCCDFTEELSPAVAAAIPDSAVQAIEWMIQNNSDH